MPYIIIAAVLFVWAFPMLDRSLTDDEHIILEYHEPGDKSQLIALLQDLEGAYRD